MKSKQKHIHFIGIKGVGMTALAVVAKEAGYKVTGSDVAEVFITDSILKKHKIPITTGFDGSNVDRADLAMVITTGAHDVTSNPEVLAAKSKNIATLSLGAAVGKMMDGKLFLKKKPFGISVSGTHGKTTTTAMIATLLKASGIDTSYLIGTSEIPALSGPGHLGKSKYLVVEADEYATDPKQDTRPKFFWQHPEIIVVTNIDYDHPDVYSSLDEVTDAFFRFIESLPDSGCVVANGDDENIQNIIKNTKKRIITYGFSPKNMYSITRLKIEEKHMFVSFESRGVALGDFFLRISGRHNALNALAAIVVGVELGLSISTIKAGITQFTGTKRRMEYLGKLASGAELYDDYAHHPKEVDETLKALRAMYPKKKIIMIFQPHTYSRTKKLFDQFISSFKKADIVGIMDIFASAREEKDPTVTSELIVRKLKEEKRDVFLLNSQSSVIEYLDKTQPDERWVVVLMGAGDIYKATELLKFEK